MAILLPFCISTALVLWPNVVYPLILLLISFFTKDDMSERVVPLDKDSLPFITLIIPTYNESEVIGEKLDNAFSLTYPKRKYEVLLIDSGSTDNTVEVAEAHAQNRPVTVLREPVRRGKAAALNNAMQKARGSIIFTTDANCRLNREALLRCIAHFRNPKVGGVCGRFSVKNNDGQFDNQNSVYWNIEERIRVAESKLDSAISMSGEITAVRKSLCKYDENNLSEDFELALRLRKNGYKIEYEPLAIATEEVPAETKSLIKQKKRSAIGTIQCLVKYRTMIFNPRYGLYGMLILPSHKVAQMLSPFIFALWILSIIPLLYFINPLFLLTPLAFFMAIFVISLFVRVGRNPIAQLILFWLTAQLIIVFAWRDYLLKKYSVNWDKYH